MLEKMISKKKMTCKWIKCLSCRKLFTQTTYGNKSSQPKCPHCGRNN